MHWRLILGLVGTALAAAALFAWSGVYSVAATSGHYPFFSTFLDFALRQSVATQARGIAAPPLDDPMMIRRGAGHYHGGCAPCHGAPGEARSPVSRGMLPEPPDLGPQIGEWTPAQLFWIVRHGIKYTGMPAWPAPQRADEVWDVVAFLLRLPGMDAAAYRRLALGETEAAVARADEELRLLLLTGPTGNGLAACARCHGRDGGGDGAFPRLQGQSAEYLAAALEAYARSTRPSGVMQPVAAALDPMQIRLLAAHYAGQQPTVPNPPEVAEEDLALGGRIARDGLPDRGVAACATCHGPGPGAPNLLYPRLSGQQAGYIATQLTLFMTGVRGPEAEGPRAGIMARALGVHRERLPARPSLWPLRPDEVRAVALWYAAQPAGAR
ncbi:cytochrome C [Roseomonas hellenica]|uniref:Cytochrome C n=1 Tax=Plastoroseomonas hellenica TaxID=2687306 RepID=A0ABS5EYZ1_9PROT|nr:c-type cytochrome [Plastoroseomonas hellenica]MBR0665512.1 cytochrome C [Plastoroseomonas hellenica]